ncbi:MAG: tRNA lysidine(34) synthetase TilS [Deltaproteobacteria bacterium]|nr:tRNA lysidine(34) synthetase TilS [Deltaproteobacteria bacterium]
MFVKDIHLLTHSAEKIILGVSGGVDSSVLLDLLSKKGFKNIVVAHLNHGLRPHAQADALFVLEKAEFYGYLYEYKNEDVKLIASSQKMSIEEAGRHCRYAFFKELCKKHEASYVVTAHTADDLIETIHMNLLRNTGIRGLCGIQPKSILCTKNKIYLLRPLSRTWKKEILDYARNEKIQFREDASNQNPAYLRNRIRRLVGEKEKIDLLYKKNFLKISDQAMKLEKKIKAVIHSVISRNQGIDISYMENIGTELAPVQSTSEGHALRLTNITPFTPYFQLRILESYIQKTLDNVYFRLTRSEFLEISKLIEAHKNNEVRIRNFFSMIKEYGYLIIHKNVRVPDSYEYQWDGRKSIEIPETGHTILPNASFKEISENVAFMDQSRLKRPLTVRNFRQGDRFQPLGMKNFKKLHDFFIDKKVPKRIRYSQPIVLDQDGDIIWVCGYALCEKVKLSPNSQSYAHFVLVNPEQ